jgi:lysophospholipase L1-like esterase
MAKNRVRLGALAVIGLSLSIGIWQIWERTQRRAISDTIIGPWDKLGGEPWLLPNLDDARVAQPDRPHSFKEVHAWRQGEDAEINRIREYRLRTNSQRLRGPEIGPKKGGVTRIIALGDSVTHGWGVAENESYPSVLEAKLRARGHAVEIINAGVPANPVSVMERWCSTQASAFSPDLILWTRRVNQQGPDPYGAYARAVRDCGRRTGATMVVVLPPVSTFDVKGSRAWKQERDKLKQMVGRSAAAVVDLTPALRNAGQGRGEILLHRGQNLAVFDQESKRTWLEVAASPHDLPQEIYALFEAEPSVRESLFFDDGHPDADGFKVFAEALVPVVEPLLPGQAKPE